MPNVAVRVPFGAEASIDGFTANCDTVSVPILAAIAVLPVSNR
jgi:hypothetical protein